jgi:hypothetical protein
MHKHKTHRALPAPPAESSAQAHAASGETQTSSHADAAQRSAAGCRVSRVSLSAPVPRHGDGPGRHDTARDQAADPGEHPAALGREPRAVPDVAVGEVRGVLHAQPDRAGRRRPGRRLLLRRGARHDGAGRRGPERVGLGVHGREHREHVRARVLVERPGGVRREHLGVAHPRRAVRRPELPADAAAGGPGRHAHPRQGRRAGVEGQRRAARRAALRDARLARPRLRSAPVRRTDRPREQRPAVWTGRRLRQRRRSRSRCWCWRRGATRGTACGAFAAARVVATGAATSGSRSVRWRRRRRRGAGTDRAGCGADVRIRQPAAGGQQPVRQWGAQAWMQPGGELGCFGSQRCRRHGSGPLSSRHASVQTVVVC